MSVFQEPKIDGHVHVLDPANFPFGKDIDYKPSGQEIGTPRQLAAVMQTYGVTHALLVQPNSGYGPDNSCILDAIARGGGRFKGPSSTSTPTSWRCAACRRKALSARRSTRPFTASTTTNARPS
jgi:hypothetical protein